MTRIRSRSMVADVVTTEAQLQAAVIAQARSLGWGVTRSAAEKMAEEATAYGVPVPPLDGLVFHPRYSLGSEPGWPDLVLIRRRDRRLIFAELKNATKALSPRQVEVLELLRVLEGEHFTPRSHAIGVGTGTGADVVWNEEHVMTTIRIEVHVWRPSHLLDGTIEGVLR